MRIKLSFFENGIYPEWADFTFFESWRMLRVVLTITVNQIKSLDIILVSSYDILFYILCRDTK